MATTQKPKLRDAAKTKSRIMAAAKREFAKHGFAGARVDEIADRAKANKRMIYHYFGSKEGLFQAVLEDAYLDIRTAEQRLDLEDMPAMEALEKLVRFTWAYYLENPEFITLVNSENLHHARHLKKSKLIPEISAKFVGMMDTLLERGVREGIFRPDLDPTQVNITIAAIGYYYLTNRFTGSIIFDRDLTAPEALEARIEFNVDTIKRLVAA